MSPGDKANDMGPGQLVTKRFSGSIEYLRLIDLLQVSCLAKLSHVIRVDSPGKTGSLYLDAGKVVHAQSGELTGEEGFFELLKWERGLFKTEPLPQAAPVSINHPWEYLLLQALQGRYKSAVDIQNDGPGTQVPSHGFSGNINDITAMDLIQLICLDSIDRIVELRTDTFVGTIYVREGQVCHAATGDLTGPEAFFKMVNASSGTFVTLPFSKECETTINIPWERLLIEAMRFSDETPAETGGQCAQDMTETLLQKLQKKNISEKIRLAMLGDKETRGVLIRDSNRLIQLAVIGNPRITDSEVAAIACSRQVDEEVLRRIAADKEWIKIYTVRLALVVNPRTSVTVSRKLLPSLNRLDLRNISRSKSVPTVVASEARKYFGK